MSSDKTKHTETAFSGEQSEDKVNLDRYGSDSDRNKDPKEQVMQTNIPLEGNPDKEFDNVLMQEGKRQRRRTILRKCRQQKQARDWVSSLRGSTRCVAFTVLLCVLIACIPLQLYLIVKTIGEESSDIPHRTSALFHKDDMSDGVCFSNCKVVGNGALPVVSRIHLKSIDAQACCLKGHRHYQLLADLLLTAYQRHRPIVESGNSTRNDSGVLSTVVETNRLFAEEHNLELNISELSTTKNYKRLPWKPCDRYRHNRWMPQNVTYDNKNRSFTVRADGVYYLYSSLTLTQYRNTSPASILEDKSHFIYRKQHSEDTGKLLMMRNFDFATSNRFFLSTELGGAFHFRKGDELYAKASSVHRIYHAYVLNRFGIYRIS